MEANTQTYSSIAETAENERTFQGLINKAWTGYTNTYFMQEISNFPRNDRLH